MRTCLILEGVGVIEITRDVEGINIKKLSFLNFEMTDVVHKKVSYKNSSGTLLRKVSFRSLQLFMEFLGSYS